METNDRQWPGVTPCTSCSEPISTEAGFCNYCGARQPGDAEDAFSKQRRFTALTIFFGVHLLVCLITNFTPHARGLHPVLAADAVLSAFTLIYVAVYWQELKQLLLHTRLSIAKAAMYATTSIIVAVVVNTAVRWLNRTIFDTNTHYYFMFSHLRFPKLLTLLVVAVQPAVFEELAFRGVMQEGLIKVVGGSSAIFISAFLFSLLHMSFISFFWLMPFALWLGYVRQKEGTLWYGMLIHFCFNATACLLEFIELHLL